MNRWTFAAMIVAILCIATYMSIVVPKPVDPATLVGWECESVNPPWTEPTVMCVDKRGAQ